MKSKFQTMCALVALNLLTFYSSNIYAQALKNVADKFEKEVTGAKTSVETGCRALCAIFILIGIVGAAWKGTSDHNDGAKAWGKWILGSILIGIAFGVASFFL